LGFIEKVELLAFKEADTVGCFGTVLERDCTHEATSSGGGWQVVVLCFSILGWHEWHGVELRFESRSHGATHLGALDLLTSHVGAQVTLAAEEGFVVVRSLVSSCSEAMESV